MTGQDATTTQRSTRMERDRVRAWRMLGAVALAAAVAACRPAGPAAFDEALRPPTCETIAIAEPAQALTFARVRASDGASTVLAVTAYAQSRITAVDVSQALGRPVADPIEVFLAEGYDALRALVERADPQTVREFPADALLLPVDLGDRHIAAGTNFPEHADEADVEEGPFLFAKLVTPTGPYADIPAGEALLDYEVELAWVSLQRIEEGDTPASMGLILCNDVTDRGTLMRHVEISDVASGAGFATGKSFPGFLPVGNLFVIPRDYRAFVPPLQLDLYVNGRLRQRSPASRMIWDIDALFDETWARKGVTWEHRGDRVSLLDAAGGIPGRTLLMAGTPHGTIFQGIGWKPRAVAVFRWLFGGWSRPLPTYAIEAYIADARATRMYLQPGDRIQICVDRLGVLDNAVVP